MPNHATEVRELVSALIADVAAKLTAAKADGKLDAAELWDLAGVLVGASARRLIAALVQAPIDGPAKRKLVAEAVVQVYEQAIAPLDIPGVPNWVEPLVDRGIGLAVAMYAEQLVSVIYGAVEPYLGE